MVTSNMNPYGGLLATPQVLPSAEAGYGGKIIGRWATITMASQASGSTFKAMKARAGELFCGGYLLVDTSTGSATLSVGLTGDTARYKALAAITTTNLPTWFLSNVAASTPWLTDPVAPFTSDVEFLITTAAASLPSSGILSFLGLFMAP